MIQTTATGLDHSHLLDDIRAASQNVDAIDRDLRPYLGQAAANLATKTALPSDITDLLRTVATDSRYLRLPFHDARNLKLALLGLLIAIEEG